MPIEAVTRASGAAPRSATLTQRASLNALQSLLDYAAKLGVGLVVTPLLVNGLGRSLYGVWEMLARLIGYMSAADGRPTEALRLVVAAQQNATDPAVHRRTVGSALVVWLLFCPVIFAIGAVLVWLAPAVTKVPPPLHATVRLAAVALLVSFLLGTLAAVPESVLRGMNLGYKRMGLQAGLNVVGGALTAGAIYAGLGLVGVAAAQAALFGLLGLGFWVLVKRYVPWFGVARPSRAEVRALVGMSAWIAGGEVIAKLALASDVLVLGMVVSSAVVTTYVLTGFPARIALGLYHFSATAAQPGLGAVIGKQQYGRAGHLRGELLVFTWLFVTAAGATILLWNRSFLALWVGLENYAGMWPNALIMLAAAQAAVVRCDSYILDAMLQPRLRVMVGVGAAALIIAASVTLTPALGIVGICLGVLAGRCVQTVAYPILVERCLGHRPGLPLRRIVRPLVVMGLMYAGAAYLGDQLLVRRWLEWAAGVALTLALALGVAFAAGLTPEARRAVFNRSRALVGGIRG